MTTSSAPGKIILFGEHAVVYGYPALAVPVTQVQTKVTVSENSRGGIMIEAPNVNLSAEFTSLAPDNPLAAVIKEVLSTLEISNPPACTICIQSTIPVAAGLGSGAAVSVAVTRALSTFLGTTLPDEKVNEITFNAEKLFHGTPSGIDNTVITYERPVYFINRKVIKTFHIGAPFMVMIGGTGIAASTKESVTAVKALWEVDKKHWDKVFARVGEIVWNARQAIERGDKVELGKLMNANHSLLQEMTVSCKELDELVEAALKSGALGAKLSGGGRGGNMIALVEKENAPAVARALGIAGAKRTILTQIG